MVYTSIKSGLVAGRSGFCTAARHREISDALVGRIENLSGQYDRGSTATRPGGQLPVIYSHRIVGIRGREWHLIMRIGDAGNDYSGRTNHIAHSFIFEPEEVARIGLTPAELILHLIREGRWLERYTDAAKFFGKDDELHAGDRGALVKLPAEQWRDLTGSAANAAHLFDLRASMGAGLVNPDGIRPDDLLRLFAESQLLASPDRSRPSALWSRSFTTLMQSSEQRGDFDWYGCDYNGPVHMQMLKSDRCLIELTKGLAPPAGRYADIAEGRAVAAEEKSAVWAETNVTAKAAQQASGSAGSGVAMPSVSLLPHADLLGGRKRQEKKKKGVPALVFAVCGLCVAGLLGAAAFVMLGESKAERFTRENLDSLRERGDWDQLRKNLEELGDRRSQFRIDHPPFATLDDMAKLAEKYRWILDHDPNASLEKAPGGDGVGNLVDYRVKTEDEWKPLKKKLEGEKVGQDWTAILQTLKNEAETKIENHLDRQRGLMGAWEALATGNQGEPKDVLAKLGSADVSDDSDLGLGSKYLKAAIETVERFEALRGRKIETEEAAQKAGKEKAELEKQILEIANRAEGRPWSGQVAKLQTMIGSFEPKMEIKIDPKMIAALKPATPKDEPEAKPAEVEKGIAIPTTYFWKVVENAKYSYSGIQEMTETIPAKPYLTPRNSFQDAELADIRTSGLFVNSNIYPEDKKVTPVFEVTSGKTLEPKGTIPDLYKNGFLLAFSNTPNSPPDFQIVAQRPSPSPQAATTEPFFLELQLDRALSKEDGTITLTDETKQMLRQLRFGGGETEFILVLKSGVGAISEWRNKDASEIVGNLVEGKNREVALAEENLKAFEALASLSTTFDGQFARLGERLFCDADGERWLYQLKEKRVQNMYDFQVEKEKEADGLELVKTLAEYKPKGGRPSLIDYVNYHLYEVFLGWGTGSGSTLTNQDLEFLKKNFVGTTNNDKWGPDAIKNALDGWKNIRERSKELKWGVAPDLTPVDNENAMNDKKIMYRTNRFRSDFFRRWEEVFTDANIDLIRTRLLGGEFKQEELEKIKTALESLNAERDSIADHSLPELGQFYLVARSGTDYFRILKFSAGNAQ